MGSNFRVGCGVSAIFVTGAPCGHQCDKEVKDSIFTNYNVRKDSFDSLLQLVTYKDINGRILRRLDSRIRPHLPNYTVGDEGVGRVIDVISVH